QAEDGIRDFHVTGVQTCALPISLRTEMQQCLRSVNDVAKSYRSYGTAVKSVLDSSQQASRSTQDLSRGMQQSASAFGVAAQSSRSEERRVGKDGGRLGVADP